MIWFMLKHRFMAKPSPVKKKDPTATLDEFSMENNNSLLDLVWRDENDTTPTNFGIRISHS